MSTVLVITPTYNERDNLPAIVTRIRAAAPAADILIVDDNSPDGTGQIADDLAAALDGVHVLHRERKEGLGAAYLAGFRWGLERGFDLLAEIDADGSHPPERLPAMLRAAQQADLVIGSRWTAGGRVANWPRRRELLSRLANRYVRTALRLPVADATGGFRVYRAAALEEILRGEVESRGYCFQVDLTLRAVRLGYVVTEVPITFVDRTNGTSKMNAGVLFEALWRVTVWACPLRRHAADPTTTLRRSALSI
ncbi:Dolichol-phosphate mannosyltransferase in lipid-linked oligosaccharide synthesis cluster [[Actinomadura] parvosata subsp. kistnae]|uniref:Dolichol-phosphate mannosyltransferase n=1 Tax=[Actinomadura] parvosata subsp. kistnae TaxID=1909395 RepID=A0A1U9ZUT9_9ACTN|nr:polyprenol monophosphomannose synthase [Nonomuraea sp. ATCC 55076]AQZ61723.1 dolichol-phosphate mannosyltransferase [Nonomuraea sp. ATCC 55076]SPL87837.1 Dolichol-phosphate mannosyltransferase in lipid-linked oligosaccharide synthesis cluster [Actinomadura parvosata subsp. kistnae]